MLRNLTIILLALVMLGGATAWAEIERNPGSRSGAETEEPKRARPVEPAATGEEESSGPVSVGDLLPLPVYLTTDELARVQSIVSGVQQAALAVAELAVVPTETETTTSTPMPVPIARPTPQFDFPESFGAPPDVADDGDDATTPEDEPLPVIEPAPAMDAAQAPPVVLDEEEIADEPVMENAEEPVEDAPDEPAARPERLKVYSSTDLEDDARELVAKIQDTSATLGNDSATDDYYDNTPVVVEDEPATDRELEFHTNWKPGNVDAQRGLGGTARELPQDEPAAAEPVTPDPVPLPEPPADEPAAPVAGNGTDTADTDSLVSDGYPLDALLGRSSTTTEPAPAPQPEPTPAPVEVETTPTEPENDPAESIDRPRLNRETGRREWSFDGRTDPMVQTNSATRGYFTPLLMESTSRTRPPREPRLYLGEPAMPDWPVGSTVTSLSRGNPRRRQVALTFDDGPHPEYTSQLLSVLDFYDVPATFFFVGVQAQKYPHWVKMTHQAGHELANHTYDHFRLPKLPREEKVYQIDEFQRLVENLTGVTPRFLRPPGGRLDGETSAMLTDRGMVLALWDVAINDTRDGKTKDDTLGAALKNIRPGSVVLCHDGIQATVDMLPELITTLRAQGYEFVTLSEMASGL